jgi:hypothetical protein
MVDMNSRKTMSTDMSTLIKVRIDSIAPTISTQPLGLAHHLPESWAQTAKCFENVSRKVADAGGRIQFGWTFHHRFVESIPGPGYLFLTHHAVWHASDGRLVNVTPYPDSKHFPLPRPDYDILFLIDDNAEPVRNERLIAPLPLRFFALTAEKPIVAYANQLNEIEQMQCAKIYSGQNSAN